MNHARKEPFCDAPEAAMRAAGAWLARRDRGFTTAEAAEFAAWLEIDRAHVAAVSQLERTMLAFDRLPAFATNPDARPDADFFAPRRRPLRWLVPSLGLAAAAMLAVLLWLPWTARAPAPQVFATDSAAQQRFTLADGSVIALDHGTQIETRFSASQRQLRLVRGAAHFQVAKDATRPFVVTVGTVSVRAIGTAFQIRLESQSVEVLVTHGKVAVVSARLAPEAAPRDAAPDSNALIAGQKLIIPAGGALAEQSVANVTVDEVRHALAWLPRLRSLHATPLLEIVAEINRQNRTQLVIADPALESLQIGGTVRTDQPEAFARLLESSFGVTVERAEATLTLRRAQP